MVKLIYGPKGTGKTKLIIDQANAAAEKAKAAVPVHAPAKGQMLWEVDVTDVSMAPSVGTEVRSGEVMGHVQTYYGMEEIVPPVSGRIVAVCAKHGDNVVKGEIVAFVQ